MNLEEFTEQTAPLYNQVGAAVLAVCGDRDIAEDSAQEALFRYWLEVDRGTEIRNPKAWTMSNLSLSAYGSRAESVPVDSACNSVSASIRRIPG
ncbi:MAG TPA: hypothetical protein VL068_05415 [Microthrixaceae bacterium]|nr:hypothetical protein [Microthrixaceae bacterium]